MELHMILALDDATMREINLCSDSYEIANSSIRKKPFGFFPNDLQLFMIYLTDLKIISGERCCFTERESSLVAKMLPKYLIGEWAQNPLPDVFLDEPIKVGYFIEDIWDLKISDGQNQIEDDDVWKWLANIITNRL